MSRSRLLAGLVFLTLTGQAGAQGIYLSPGPTTPGIYFNSLGFPVIRLVSPELDKAWARALDTATNIRWNEYVTRYADPAERYRAVLQQKRDERNQFLQEIYDRVHDNPQELDVLKGNALNVLKSDLLNPKISESSLRYAAVPLPVDVVRQIPFTIGRESLTFSMQRITAKGKDKWPPGLQDDVYIQVRQAYERALDTVLEQQIEGKMQDLDIDRVGEAIKDLRNKLNEVRTPSTDKLYMDAKRRIADFQRSYDFMIKSHQAQLVVGDLDGYSGTTVYDLLVFMRDHGLGFGVAVTKDEIELYSRLYKSLRAQQEALHLPPGSLNTGPQYHPGSQTGSGMLRHAPPPR
jgi:hypothetical protein